MHLDMPNVVVRHSASSTSIQTFRPSYLIRMAHKYQLSNAVDAALAYLQSHYPATLANIEYVCTIGATFCIVHVHKHGPSGHT